VDSKIESISRFAEFSANSIVKELKRSIVNPSILTFYLIIEIYPLSRGSAIINLYVFQKGLKIFLGFIFSEEMFGVWEA
jgi:hypothetical protein